MAVVNGKTITLFLMDGSPSGRVKCKIDNWIGLVYRISRRELETCKDIKELSHSSVYFLFGVDNDTEENVVYVGQAATRQNGGAVLDRLQEHIRNPKKIDWKAYWNEVVVLTTNNDTYGLTEISYLENRFYTLATEANRYHVKNGNSPMSGNITEEKESELETFIDNAKTAIGMLGYKVFEKLDKAKLPSERTDTSYDEGVLLHLKRKIRKSKQTIEANCKQTNEGFVVLKGSQIETIDSDPIPPGVKDRRQKAKIENGILQEDVLFRSPSYAAAFVIGGHANGLTEWKTENGKTLKEN